MGVKKQEKNENKIKESAFIGKKNTPSDLFLLLLTCYSSETPVQQSKSGGKSLSTFAGFRTRSCWLMSKSALFKLHPDSKKSPKKGKSTKPSGVIAYRPPRLVIANATKTKSKKSKKKSELTVISFFLLPLPFPYFPSTSGKMINI